MNIAKLALPIFPAILLYSAYTDAEVQENTAPERKQEEQCVYLLNQRTAAIVAGDSKRSMELSKQFIETCKSISSPKDIAHARHAIATAHIELGNPDAALLVSNECTEVHYSFSPCHFAQAEAFVSLGRFGEARLALTVAEKLVDHELESNNREIISSAHPSDRELLLSERKFLQALRSQIVELGKKIRR